MTISVQRALVRPWVTILEEYERVKAGRSPLFSTVTELCEAHRVHRKDIRKYYERWMKSGKTPSSLLPQKRGPGVGKYKMLTKDEERIIVKIRRRLGANEFEIFHLLENRFRVHPSVSTIYRTLTRYPLNTARKTLIKRYVKRYPGELLHADTYRLSKAIMTDRKRYFVVGVEDDCSRLTHATLVQSTTAADVTQAVYQSVRFFLAHGIRPECIMTDNGSEFTAFTSQKAKQTHFFETMLKMTGIDHICTQPYHPQTNGKIERFWQILQNECLCHLTPGQTPESLTEELNNFLYRYNYERRHGGLNYTTPLDRLRLVASVLEQENESPINNKPPVTETVK